MKILIVNSYYYPNMVGGTENSVKLLAENLKNAGNDVAVYCIDGKDKLKKETINDVVIYRGVGGNYKLLDKMNNCETPIVKIKNKIIEINNKKIKEEFDYIVKDFQPEMMHTNNLFGISNFIWKYAKEKYNISITHTLRDYWMLYPIVSKKTLSRILIQPFMRKRTKYVDIVTAPSKYTLNEFLDNDFFKNSIQKCVPNAVNIDMKETEKILKQRNKNNDSNIRFMYVGMLTENKGIKNLLNAFSMVDSANITLDMYGKGELESFVNEYCKKDSRVTYHGQLSKEQLKEEWIKNDVAIVPSVWQEPFGRVVIEANQYGLPVIGSNRGGILEIINNIQTGITYQYDSVEELSKYIEYFSNRDNIKKYYENIKNNINTYSGENQTVEFTKLYNQTKKNI